MEPSLEDIDDYKKPLKKSKLKNILIGFGILLTLFIISALVQSNM
ncbi:hypothetical protein [Sulfurimonas sp.]|nr:hypothetical protein [Sulfurimonas sp.]MCW8895895.1 hypothetical protein [Sulfurimonas sp.]